MKWIGIGPSVPSFSWGHHDGYGGGGGGGIGAVLFMVLLFLIAILVFVTAYVAYKTIALVGRAWIQCDGKSAGLRWAIVAWLGGAVLVIGSIFATATNELPTETGHVLTYSLLGLLGIVTIVLIVTARVVEVQYRQTFMPEPEQVPLVTKVLRRPWWSTRDREAA